MGSFVIKNNIIKEYSGEVDEEIIIPENAKEFRDGAPVFLDLDGEFALTLPNNFKCSANDLLCQGITKLAISKDTVIEINPGDFNSDNGSPFYKKLRAIDVDADHSVYTSVDGVLYDKKLTTLICCPRGYTGKISLPCTVKNIYEKAFYGCSLITEVVIPEGVTEIKSRTFADCKSLEKIILPKSVNIVGKEAFLRCSGLKTAGLKGTGGKKGYSYEFSWTDSIPDHAFDGMKALKSVVLPETVKVIGKNAFKSCSNLETINLSDSIKFDSKAFKDCKKLSF